MSWEDAHRYNQALRDIRADLDVVPDIALVWRPEYRQIFGSPEQLVLALRSRWNTMLQAQVEEAVTEDGEPTATVRALAAANRGLVRSLARVGAIADVDPTQAFMGAA
jgi:hypothetical protein